jgi:nucleoside diphosphate kinase
MKERVLLLIKPDAFEKKVVSLIQGEIEAMDLRLVEIWTIVFDISLLKAFYGLTEIRYPYEIVERYLCGRSLTVWIVEGERSIHKIGTIKSTMRMIYGTDRLINLFHSSLSVDEFNREYGLLIEKGASQKSLLECKSS